MTRLEQILRLLALICAGLLILVSLNGRSVWIKGPHPSQYAATIRDAAGWDWLARGAGIVAILTLSGGLHVRSRGVGVVLMTASAVACGWAAIVAWRYWVDLANGAGLREGWVLVPATNMPAAAALAGVVTGCSLVITLNWLRRRMVRERAGDR